MQIAALDVVVLVIATTYYSECIETYIWVAHSRLPISFISVIAIYPFFCFVCR